MLISVKRAELRQQMKANKATKADKPPGTQDGAEAAAVGGGGRVTRSKAAAAAASEKPAESKKKD